MKIRRREFIGAASAMAAGMATTRVTASQEGGPVNKAAPVPTRQPRSSGSSRRRTSTRTRWRLRRTACGSAIRFPRMCSGWTGRPARCCTSDPDPQGMCIRDGSMYYCDAGLTAPRPAANRRRSVCSRWCNHDQTSTRAPAGRIGRRHADRRDLDAGSAFQTTTSTSSRSFRKTTSSCSTTRFASSRPTFPRGRKRSRIATRAGSASA